MRIDAHHHFWKYDPIEYGWIGDSMQVLKLNYLPEQLRDIATSSGITGVVSVQARQTIEETQWLIELAQRYELIRGVVGWAPLSTPELSHLLEEWTHHGWLKSIRHVVQDEPDGFMDAAAFNQGIDVLPRYDLAYDILTYARQLPEAIRLVDRHPKIRFILDHISKPTIQSSQFDVEWEKNLRELSKRTNVACKFSGVVTEVRDEKWNADLLRRYWDVAWECFGDNRLMFGSDWPVCLLKASHLEWTQTCKALIVSHSPAQQQSFWHDAAVHWYQL
jgi:L-fuconolactonase